MTAERKPSVGPHAVIPVDNARDRLAAVVLDRLWDRYRDRVSYVRDYETLVASHGGRFVNDHIAFRTFALQQPPAGIISLSRIFEALGYVGAGAYHFPDKHLNAIHYQHSNSLFPKIFISELRVWELPPDAAETIFHATQPERESLSLETLRELSSLKDERATDAAEPNLFDPIVRYFEELPWDIPRRDDVELLNHVSQYAAWVLVHGYNVNHFTSLINSHGVDSLSDIEKTVAALKQAGVPMKAEIEGAPGSKLRQTATEAVRIDVPMREGSHVTPQTWSYAYFELAERGETIDPDSGERRRFEAFLGPQATNLFEMTRTS
ncbi:MAG: DUF1338 domain-containing protein [Planctomycetales bacterium]|nr:DUF1338 domain-containing protein [Planctomycetales bacterium]